ncbi:MAG: hypothetical protein AAF348_16310 [Bacteroidota bacterium]
MSYAITLIGQSSSKTYSLALELQNPAANLVQFPVSFDYEYGYEPFTGNRTSITVEPVIHSKLNQNWNVVFRLVAPFATQSDIILMESMK